MMLVMPDSMEKSSVIDSCQISDGEGCALRAMSQRAISSVNIHGGTVHGAVRHGSMKSQQAGERLSLSFNDDVVRAVFSGNEEMARVYFKNCLRYYDRVMRCVEEETHPWMPADRDEVWILFVSQIVFAFVGKTRSARNIDAYAMTTLFSAVNTVWSKIQKRGEGQLSGHAVSSQMGAELEGNDKDRLHLHPTVKERVLGKLLGIPDIPGSLVAACIGIDKTDVNDDMLLQASENVMGETPRSVISRH